METHLKTMIRKPPIGYKSWIELYDFISQKPELLRHKTLLLAVNEGNGNIITFKVSIATIQRNCWKEIESLRPDMDDVYRIFHLMFRDSFINPKISGMLLKTGKYEHK